MIKTTMLTYKKFVPQLRGKGLYARTRKTFIQYVAENNNSVYVVDGNLSSLEEGNRAFTQILKKYRDAKVEKEILETTDAEILDNLNGMIDNYTQYIDDYNQQKEAELVNDKIRNIIKEFQRVSQS